MPSAELRVLLGDTPHPSIAMSDRDVVPSDDNGERPLHVELLSGGTSLGVLRWIDSGRRDPQHLTVSPKAWLRRSPSMFEMVEVRPATTEEYQRWLKEKVRGRRRLFFVSVFAASIAAVIEAFWNIGRYWTLFTPGDFLAGMSQLVKWALLAFGVTGVAKLNEYRSIE